MPRTYLLTGFPGFLAGRLVPRLLQDDDEARIVALVEPRMVGSAPARWRPTASTSSPATSPTRARPRRAHLRAARRRDRQGLPPRRDLRPRRRRRAGRARQRRRAPSTSSTSAARPPSWSATTTSRRRTSPGTRSGLVLEDDLAEGQDVQELLRVDQVRRRGPRARVDGRRPDDDLPPGDRGRRLADRRDAEVRRPLLPAALDGERRWARCCRSAAATRRSTSCRSTSSSTRSPPARATPRPSATRCTSSTPSRSPRPSWSRCWRCEYAGREPKLPLPPGLVDRSLRFGAGAQAVRRHAAPVDRLPQPPGALRHRRRPASARPQRAALPALPEYVGAMVRFFRARDDDAYRPAHER